ALAPQVEEAEYELRRILQIDVDRDDDVGVDMVQAGGQGGFLAEIAREGDQADRGVFFLDRPDRRPRGIGAAVVDEDHRDRAAGRLERIFHRAIERRDRVRFVQYRYDESYAWL